VESVKRTLRLWFGFSDLVDRRSYLLSGVTLMAAKYLGDLWLMSRYGLGLTPFEFLNPILSQRIEGIVNVGKSADLAAQLLLWALPFAWIGASMTIRRLIDADYAGWLGLLFFVPGSNVLLMIALCVAPSEPHAEVPLREIDGTRGVFDRDLPVSVAGGFFVGLLVFAICTYLGQAYGMGLFIGGPFMIGFVTGALLSRRNVRTKRATLLAVQVPIGLLGGALLLFAAEGVICLVMAYPLAAAFAFIGGLAGRMLFILGRRPMSHAMIVLLVAPGMLAVEPERQPPLRTAVTTIEIDAPPEVVWKEVVAFSELPPPSELLFRTGIAYPMRAEIDGEGVGAVRHCVFSTGAFVEPIPVWDEPHRLAFDVVEQPPTMEEWSPYKNIEPAHLTEGLHSERGEFRHERLADGGTRLTGTTWYRSYLFPQVYWGAWTDWIIHSIHERVLDHIRVEAEREHRHRIQEVSS